MRHPLDVYHIAYFTFISNTSLRGSTNKFLLAMKSMKVLIFPVIFVPLSLSLKELALILS